MTKFVFYFYSGIKKLSFCFAYFFFFYYFPICISKFYNMFPFRGFVNIYIYIHF